MLETDVRYHTVLVEPGSTIGLCDRDNVEISVPVTARLTAWVGNVEYQLSELAATGLEITSLAGPGQKIPCAPGDRVKFSITGKIRDAIPGVVLDRDTLRVRTDTGNDQEEYQVGFGKITEMIEESGLNRYGTPDDFYELHVDELESGDTSRILTVTGSPRLNSQCLLQLGRDIGRLAPSFGALMLAPAR